MVISDDDDILDASGQPEESKVNYSLWAFITSGGFLIGFYVTMLASLTQWFLTENPPQWLLTIIWALAGAAWFILIALFWFIEPGVLKANTRYL